MYQVNLPFLPSSLPGSLALQAPSFLACLEYKLITAVDILLPWKQWSGLTLKGHTIWFHCLGFFFFFSYEDITSKNERVFHYESRVLVPQSCPTLCDPLDCSLPGSSIHGILQVSILKWVAIPFFRGSSQPRDWTWAYLHCRHILCHLCHQGNTSRMKTHSITLEEVLTANETSLSVCWC